MDFNAEEKRQFPRVELKVPLRYQIRGTAEFNNSLSEDISTGGIGFTNDKYIAPLTKLMLEVRILSQLFNPIGKVTWASPLPHSNRYRLGIEFLELEQVKKDYLKDFIDMQRDNL